MAAQCKELSYYTGGVRQLSCRTLTSCFDVYISFDANLCQLDVIFMQTRQCQLQQKNLSIYELQI